MMLERGAHSNWAKKLVSSSRLREGLSPFLGMGADCRERRARWEKFFSKGAGKIGRRKHPQKAVKGENDKLTLTFITDGIERAIEKAKAAAGDKDVMLR